MSVDALESRAYKQVYYGLWIMDEDDILSKYSNRGWRFSKAVFMIRHSILLFSVAAVIGYDTSSDLSTATRAPHRLSVSLSGSCHIQPACTDHRV